MRSFFADGRTLVVLVDRSLLALSSVTTAILFAWLLYYSRYGFNLSDESFHLRSIASPFAYPINIPPSLFGFVYHWPYQWTGGDIAVLRMANVSLTMALGWSQLPCDPASLDSGLAICNGAIGRNRQLALVEFQGWLLTPSYYTLAFQSLLMVMIGLLLADSPGRINQVLGWILIGIGGWCCFMAKPTTAAAISLVVMLYVIVLHRKSLLPMLGAALVALALLIVTAYLIDGGVTFW